MPFDPPPPPEGCTCKFLGTMPWAIIANTCPVDHPCDPPTDPGYLNETRECFCIVE